VGLAAHLMSSPREGDKAREYNNLSGYALSTVDYSVLPNVSPDSQVLGLPSVVFNFSVLSG
jgi:hypothetical protein